MNAIGERLGRIPDEFSPLREHAGRYVTFGANIDESGTVSIGPNPKVAPEYFVFRLYSPAHPDWLARRRSYEIPNEYLRFLAVTNGCFAYSMKLCGFTPSMQSSPALLNRAILQCHDLTIANEVWSTGYRLAEPLFLFGSRHYSRTENVGYFMDESGGLCSILESGREVGRWNSFTHFLRDELSASETENEPENPK